MKRTKLPVKEILDYYAAKYNHLGFIEEDPISIPHHFTKIQDIEIAGFWTAVLSWGNRKSIIKNAKKLMELMEWSPYEFTTLHSEKDLMVFEKFCHRTFQFTDTIYFLTFFKDYYLKNKSLEGAFLYPGYAEHPDIKESLENFHRTFFSMTEVPDRTRKHISRPSTKSRCKRLLMFLRWMVRKDDQGVDFGIWNNIKPNQLFIPLDVHVERSARQLGLLQRRQLDWIAAEEITKACRKIRPHDPVYYDFALFGISNEKIILDLRSSSYICGDNQ